MMLYNLHLLCTQATGVPPVARGPGQGNWNVANVILDQAHGQWDQVLQTLRSGLVAISGWFQWWVRG